MRRVVDIPAGQIREGDVIYVNDELNNVNEEAKVIQAHRDNDGEIYIKWVYPDTSQGVMFFDPWNPVKLVIKGSVFFSE